MDFVELSQLSRVPRAKSSAEVRSSTTRGHGKFAEIYFPPLGSLDPKKPSYFEDPKLYPY